MSNIKILLQWEQESMETSQWLWNLFQKIFVEFVTLADNILQIPLAVWKGVNDWLKNISKEALKLLSLEDLEEKLKQEGRYLLFLESFKNEQIFGSTLWWDLESWNQKQKNLAIEILTKELSQEDMDLVKFFKKYENIEKISLLFIQSLRKIFQSGSLEIPWIDKKEDWARDKAIFFINMMKIIDGLQIASSLELALQTILENYFQTDNLNFETINIQGIQKIMSIFSNLNKWNWEINQILSKNIEKDPTSWGNEMSQKPKNHNEYVEENLAFANNQMKQIPQKYDEYMQKVLAFADDEMKQMLEMSEEEKINFILNNVWINSENKESSIILKWISLLLQWKKLEDLFTGPNKEREIEYNENFLLNLKNEMQRLWIPTTKEELEAFIWEKLSFCILPSELITLYTSYDSKYKNTVEWRRMLIRGLKNINIGAFREWYLFAEMQINNKS